MSRFDAIIFDFDGVVVDSEIVHNAVLAEGLSELGHPTTTQEAIERYIGRHWDDTVAAIEAEMGQPLPSDFKARTGEVFHGRVGEIGAVPGVAAFLESVSHLPKAVASSSPVAWLRDSLERLGLSHHFGGRLFSAAEHVARGKPHPDIYLYAAAQLGLAPARTLVIEDTWHGVASGKAAGMVVAGLCAGGHCGAGYGERLRQSGADHVCAGYDQVLELLQ